MTTDPTQLTSELDAAWREMEADALASDGPIRDRDVRDAIKRNRARIEALATCRAIEGSGVVDDDARQLLAEYIHTGLRKGAVDPGADPLWQAIHENLDVWNEACGWAVRALKHSGYALAALPRPDELRVERCTWCGTPIAEHPLTDACAIAQESEAR